MGLSAGRDASRPKTPRFIWHFVALAVLYSVTQATDATFTFAYGQREEMRQTALSIIREHYQWKFEPGREPFPTLSHYTEAKTMIHHLFYIASCVGGYMLLIWCQSQIVVFLRRQGSSFRASTRRLHLEVNRALVALAITPLVSLIGPTFEYILQCLVDFDAPCTSYVSSVMSLITLVNPLTTMFFVRSYRNAVLRILRIKRSSDSVYTGPKVVDANGLSAIWPRTASQVPSTPSTDGSS
ncbi:hypothetical protein AAVH_16074 [Aphelenchoides avenae]|nr:hypothetical protein AAVH_16074 [Aphelenchus avenae]